MKKSKKHLKDLARLGAYLKKETARLSKMASRAGSGEASPLISDVLLRLQARREVALNDLGLVSVAEAAVRKADKADKKPKKAAQSSVAKTSAKKAAAKKAPVKRATKKATVKKAVVKPRAVKSPRGRKPKVSAVAAS